MATALGRQWIQRHQLKVLLTPTFKLVTRLVAAKGDLRPPGAVAKLERFDVVILDDLIKLLTCSNNYKQNNSSVILPIL
jgi:DNA replication protein DnaC